MQVKIVASFISLIILAKMEKLDNIQCRWDCEEMNVNRPLSMGIEIGADSLQENLAVVDNIPNAYTF